MQVLVQVKKDAFLKRSGNPLPDIEAKGRPFRPKYRDGLRVAASPGLTSTHTAAAGALCVAVLLQRVQSGFSVFLSRETRAPWPGVQSPPWGPV